MYTDFHNHALPGIDDGAATVEESVNMIRLLAEQKVRRIVFTPHYSKDQNLAVFLSDRKKSYYSVKNKLPSSISIQLAAEVSLDEGLSRDIELPKLSVDKTRYIMLRLPYFSFEDWIDAELHNILYKHRLIPIFTSVDRYRLTYPKEKYVKILGTPEAVFQFNIKSLSDSDNLKVIKYLISNNKTVLIGSDAHDMGSRKPDFCLPSEALDRGLGKPDLNYLIIQNNRFLERTRNR